MLSPHRERILIGSISTSPTEIKDILKAWIAVSAAFGILLNGGSIFSISFPGYFLISALTVGVGFLLHELAHKLVAQRYGCIAEFKSFDHLLILAIAMSFFGFVFAAPGAVMIEGPIGVRRNGKISAAGPLTNIAIAFAFLSALFFSPEGMIRNISYYGFYINALLALFNMIPFLNFDGAKVWRWSKPAYFCIVAVSGAMMLMLPYVKP